MADPKAPELPPNVPKELRDFVECTSNSVTITDGAQAWVTLPEGLQKIVGKNAKPTLSIKPGNAPGNATIRIGVGGFNLDIPASIANGKLAIDAAKLPFYVPDSIAKDVGNFVDDLNAWFGHNGWGLGSPAFGQGQVSLSKVPLAPAPGTADALNEE